MGLNLVLFGPPGAGKGTQAGYIAAARDVPQISTGDILREAVRSGSALGRRISAIIDAGELVGDEVMVQIVRDRLARPDAANGFILDGFPRTVAQAEALDGMLAGRGGATVIRIDVPDNRLVARLSMRRICSVCGAVAGARSDAALPAACAACGGSLYQRSDDREEVLRERLRVYHRETLPVVSFYSGRAGFASVDGDRSPETVRSAIDDAIDAVAGITP